MQVTDHRQIALECLSRAVRKAQMEEGGTGDTPDRWAAIGLGYAVLALTPEPPDPGLRSGEQDPAA